MKIYLLDINKNMTDAWKKYFNVFSETEDIEIVNDDFATFMDKHTNIEGIVSPANSFGLMDGGYDKAITDYFGDGLMKSVQRNILINWCGEQPIGTSMTVPIYNRIFNTILGTKYCVLIHTPTMRTPEIITDSRIIYQCTRTSIIEARRHCLKSIVIPAFGGLTGGVPFDEIAKMMYLAYKQISDTPDELNWEYAMKIATKLRS